MLEFYRWLEKEIPGAEDSLESMEDWFVQQAEVDKDYFKDEYRAYVKECNAENRIKGDLQNMAKVYNQR